MTSIASAPASSGNLGPGFDTLALALDIRCTVRASVADTLTVEEGSGRQSLHEGDMIARAVLTAVGRPVHLEIQNEVPRARGLGSSSAVTAAAAAAAMREIIGEVDRNRVYEIVCELEGHGDNAAAAVYGGLVAVADGRSISLPLSDSWRVVMAVADTKLHTAEARAVLDDEVARVAVVRNLGRLAFLLDGLRTGDSLTLGRATGDELHELPRAVLSPVSGELIAVALDAGAAHAAWSGAGPSVIAFTGSGELTAVADALGAHLGDRGTVLTPAIDTVGLR